MNDCILHNTDNFMSLTVKAVSQNESFARSVVAAFCVQLNPTLDQINDIKTAVSEAVTNCVVHAYEGRGDGCIDVEAFLKDDTVFISVSDCGCGIKDIEQAKQAFFTTKPEQERSGMGFTVMESFMDTMTVENREGGGVTVKMKKKITAENAEEAV